MENRSRICLQLSSNVTHVVSAVPLPVDAAGAGAPVPLCDFILRPAWLVACCVEDRRVDPALYRWCAREAVPPTVVIQSSLLGGADANGRSSSDGDGGGGTGDGGSFRVVKRRRRRRQRPQEQQQERQRQQQQQQQKQPQQQQNQHHCGDQKQQSGESPCARMAPTAEMRSSSDAAVALFAHCVFHIEKALFADGGRRLSRVVAKFGGRLCAKGGLGGDKDALGDDAPHFSVLPLAVPRSVLATTTGVAVTDLWMERCTRAGCLWDPATCAIFSPLPAEDLPLACFRT